MNIIVYLFIALQFMYPYLILGEKYGFFTKSKTLLMTMENISFVLNYSFPESRCCNIYINSKISDFEKKIFKLFVSVYQNKYLLRKNTYDCSDYLFIASQDLQIIKSIQRIPVSISTIRLLIFVDSILDERSLLFNISMYKNSNVNIVCPNGLFVLSENYLEPRIFKKITRLQEIKSKTRIADLKGRELDVTAFFNPPLCYLRKTINKTIKGITANVFLADKKWELDGIELNLFLIIAKTLNFTYTFRKASGPYNHGRKYNDTTWDGGMIGQVIRKEVDIAFSGIWINLENYQFTNLTEPWTQIFIQFLVPRPQAYSSFWALTRPLSPTVWLALVAVLSLESAYVYLKAWIDPLVPKQFRNIVITFTEMMGRMLGTWLPSIAPRIRLQFVLWESAGFILVTAYCSSLAARLANPEYERRIDTIQQFIEQNLTWGREGTPPNYKEYFDLEDQYAKQMPSRFILEKSVQDRTQRVLQGNHAVIGKIVGNVYYPENFVNAEALKKLRVMRQTVSQFYTSFSVQSWLVEPINSVMMRLKESGIVSYHMQDVIHRRTRTNLREVFIEHDKLDFDRTITLALNPLGAGFATLIFGLLLASIVFYTELRSAHGSLRQIFKRSQIKNVFIKFFRVNN